MLKDPSSSYWHRLVSPTNCFEVYMYIKRQPPLLFICLAYKTVLTNFGNLIIVSSHTIPLSTPNVVAPISSGSSPAAI